MRMCAAGAGRRAVRHDHFAPVPFPASAGLRRILSRGRLTSDDVQILMGIARQCHWAAQRGGAGPTAAEAP